MAVAAVHRVCARRKRLAVPAAVGRVAGGFAVDDIRRDRQDRLGVDGVADRSDTSSACFMNVLTSHTAS